MPWSENTQMDEKLKFVTRDLVERVFPICVARLEFPS
jgi:hypothetical protein